MGSGPKTTKTSDTTSHQNQTASQESQNQQTSTGHTTASQTGEQTTTPNLPDWYSNLLQQIGGQFGSLYQQAGQQAKQPLYGPQQEAAFREQLGQSLGQSRQDLNSQLASMGALNSGRSVQVNTALQLGGNQALMNYLSQVPLLNRQAQQQGLAQQAGILNSAAGFKAPFGSTTTSNQQSVQDILSQLLGSSSGSSQGTSDSTSHGTEVTQQSGGLLNSILGGLINAGLGFATGGLSNILGGKSFLGGSRGGGGFPSGGYDPASGPGVYE